VTLSPVVTPRAWRATESPMRPVELARAELLGLGGYHHAVVQDVDRPPAGTAPPGPAA
jgi:hypothetical protein